MPKGVNPPADVNPAAGSCQNLPRFLPYYSSTLAILPVFMSTVITMLVVPARFPYLLLSQFRVKIDVNNTSMLGAKTLPFDTSLARI